MFARRALLLVAVAALFASAVGCGRNRCCRNDSVSYAPVAEPCDTCR
ncbi:MAG TPA: hypothetical protein VFG68_11675 [Fimbriiglobus sp.]|nr:hypothetical protein [Fimbriiglobus sp.]